MQQEQNQNEVVEKLTSIETLLRDGKDKPLNLTEAAEYLGFSESYLYKLTSKKIIPHHKPTGKVIFFSKAELDEWIFSSNNEAVK
ncbi:MAG TPA: DNA-binding protein [Ignavibacteriales bacterium]|nr:DNA-binding protein [Ignavibacteriales bacterium]